MIRVGPVLGDSPALEDDDSVTVPDGGQPVGDTIDGAYGWYQDNSDNKPHPVGEKSLMHGVYTQYCSLRA